VNLHLGATASGKRLYIDPAVRTTHIHVLGASGRGKSYFLEHLIRQDIANGDGLCLIDPHGSLYSKIVAWCAEEPAFSWRKLILLDASTPGWTFGFNPLNFADADISYCVDSMVHACAQVWGGEDTNATPLLKRALRGIFHVLAEHKLTLLEATYLISERDELRPVREKLTDTVADPIIREMWKRWNEMPASEFRKDFASSTNRLMEFFAAPIIRLILGQTDPILDFRKAMDEGAVILVNLASSGRLSDSNARTLGTLLTNDLFLKAQARPEGSRPFYLYIDECGRYLNESIQRILDESRKRGLHLILANQHLAQLRAAGATVYSAVLTDAQ
jgi:type IV secretory pathway VirB4 component